MLSLSAYNLQRILYLVYSTIKGLVGWAIEFELWIIPRFPETYFLSQTVFFGGGVTGFFCPLFNHSGEWLLSSGSSLALYYFMDFD